MTGWLIYSAVLGLLLVAGGEMTARTARRRGQPERWIWGTALVGAVILPVVLPSLPRMTPASVGHLAMDGLAVGGGAVAAPDAAGAAALAPGFLPGLAWAGVSLILALRLLRSAVVLRRIVRRSERLRRKPLEVRMTRETGPAVAGLLRPVILLPARFRRLPLPERRWILRHELEHVRAGDPALLWLAHAARVLFPWNPAVWFIGRRLREGVEFDCDRRLLRRRPDPRSYGSTLLTMASSASRSALPVAAFSEPSLPLERRLFSMTTPTRPVSSGLLALVASVSALLLVAACEFSPTYTVVEAPGTDAPAAAATVPDATPPEREPSFTPFTVAPNLSNRAEVVAALEAEYPAELRDAGIGGTTTIWFYIDAEGAVTDTRIHEASGSPELDRAALEVARTMRFAPALKGDEPTAVWVAFPITFQVR